MTLDFLKTSWRFPGGSDGNESAYIEGDSGSIPGLGRSPWRREWQSTPVFLPGKFHGQRSLVGYSPRGRKESDTSEQRSLLLCSIKDLYPGYVKNSYSSTTVNF